jgi:hypothetical protein
MNLNIDKMVEIITYWFFIWFLLFILNITSANPFWILVIAYIITFMEFLYLIYKKANAYNLKKFMIINVVFKVVPILIILIKTNFKIPIFDVQTLKIAYVITALYIITMGVLNINPINAYSQMLNTYINDDNKYRTYISRLYDDIYSFWYPGSSRI